MSPDYYAELQLKAGVLFWIGAGLLVVAIAWSIWLGWKRVRLARHECETQ